MVSDVVRAERASETWRERLARVIDEVVAPEAAGVDRTGVFPGTAIERLGKEGLLGALSAPEVGGAGLGLAVAAEVVRELAGACGSTAMVVTMHYAATAAIEALGPDDVRAEIAAGRHLTTLAFSEAGSRSQFWVPLSTAAPTADGSVVLEAHKSFVTSATHADSYVWSSRPVAADGPMTLWLVATSTAGLTPGVAFDGLGLRGNDSRAVAAAGATVPASARLGADGAGLDAAMTHVLPVFGLLSAAGSVGLMEAAVAAATTHLTSARFEHLDRSLAAGEPARLELARLQVALGQARALVDHAVALVAAADPGAMPVVLQAKAAAAEAAATVTDGALRLGGGSALRRSGPLERASRDARAARVMAPTTETLLDFIGRLLVGLPLLGEVP